jgi:DNA-binding transcriptional LysR family regulator
MFLVCGLYGTQRPEIFSGFQSDGLYVVAMKSIKNLDLRHLRYFIAVAEQGSFSKAAAQLNIAQPPLSQQIMDMEAMIGAKLFVRDSRHVALSEAGRALLPDAKAIIEATHRAVHKAHQTALGQTGQLRIGMMNTAPHNPDIVQLLQRFSKLYPQVQTEVVVLSSRQQRDALLTDQIDLSIHWPLAAKPVEQLVTTTLQTYQFCLGVAPHHPLARQKTYALSALADSNWYTMGQKHNPYWYQFTVDFLRIAGLTHATIIERNPAPFNLLPIALGQGVGLVPEFLRTACPYIRFKPLPLLRGCHNAMNLCLSKKALHQHGPIAEFFALAGQG